MATEKKTTLLETLEKNESGLQSPVFRSACADAEIIIKGTTKGDKAPCYQLIGYDEAQNEILIFEKTFTVNENGSFTYVHGFDPVSLAVYQNARSFRARISAPEKDNPYTLTKFELIEIGQNSADMGKEQKVRKKRGPHPLRKVLFVGNSILLGIENRYGMCASSPKNDYYHYVSEAIKKAYPDCEFFKLHGSGMEHSESVEEFEDVFYKRPNGYTGRPVVDSFTPDLDLIILQITDNVNTEKKQEAFHHTSELLLSRIRERCPNAVILWVYGWYYKRPIQARLVEVCNRYDVEMVDIRPLRFKANEAEAGARYESIDGTKKEANELWLTHPGDKGMAAIADQIISVLKETELL